MQIQIQIQIEGVQFNIISVMKGGGVKLPETRSYITLEWSHRDAHFEKTRREKSVYG